MTRVIRAHLPRWPSGCPWISYVSMLVAAFALKFHYSRAGAEDLAWVLGPTAALVGGILGEELVFDAELGWFAPDGAFVIAPACAGINFLLLVFVLSVLGLTHRLPSRAHRAGWWITSALAAYLGTILVNTVRILVVVAVAGFEFPVAALTPDRVHRLAGSAVYLGGLWGLWWRLQAMAIGNPARGNPAQKPPGLAARAVIPLAYLGATALVPLVNGAWGRFGDRYLEHVLSLCAVTVSMILAGAFIRRLTSALYGRGSATAAASHEPGDATTWISH